MYNLISTIAERCHASATRRGKDTSWVGCIFTPRDVEMLRCMINLKMRYNELRKG